jgi:hypothetical protein
MARDCGAGDVSHSAGGTPAMLRQYAPQRHRYEHIRGRDMIVGTVPIGSIFRLSTPYTRRPRAFIVEAWLTRACPRRDPAGTVSYFAHGAHFAQVRSLADGRRAIFADRIIRHALEEQS